MGHLYTMECYPAMGKDEVLPFVTPWMALKNVMLRERSQTEKVKNCMVSHMWDVKLKAANEQTRWTNKQKLIDTDNSMMVTRGKGRRQ